MREREHWDDYQDAFSEMLSHTSTPWAPWYVIPADRKWFARLAAAAVLVNALMEIDPQFPVVEADVRARLADAKAELEAEAPAGAAPDPFADRLAQSSGDGVVAAHNEGRIRWTSLRSSRRRPSAGRRSPSACGILADMLARHNDLEFDRGGMHFTVHVPDQLQLKVELEVETDERELEIELKW